ncbi:MAG TPA: M15 family metallopeptidase [bacterium]|jgi:D-alanyl-D-alanine dipeptidase|nr:M15 family metallopeptidase [bacterium]
MDADLFAPCREGSAFMALSELPFVVLDLRYASADNLCGRDLYGGEREAWLHLEAWRGLKECGRALLARQAGWKFRVYDAARPLSVQSQLFAMVAGTPRQAYVADPQQGSVHNFGFALDLGLQDQQGRELDFGTPFDSFDPLAQPQLEEAFLAQGRLSAEQLGLRRLLRQVMAAGGFQQHPMEWWHFDRRPLEQLTGQYPMLVT